MIRTDLCGVWKMTGNGFSCDGTVPGSIYSFLLENKLMDDPFYRDNELEAFNLLKKDYTFIKTFSIAKTKDPVLLHCDGLDTLCDIVLNGNAVASTDNMHRSYEFDVSEFLIDGENKLELTFRSPIEYVRDLQKKEPIIGVRESVLGYGWLRKANCMFGWDWGPRLPDAGIFRPIYLLTVDSARITGWHLAQRHENGKVFVIPTVDCTENAVPEITLTDRAGKTTVLKPNAETEIENPRLWWPNGMGEQYLYDLKISLPGDVVTAKVGLRTLKLVREPDEFGESFYHEVNGVPFFAMGADYIPEDNILSRVTPERSRTLLQIGKDCHFNAIRIWGGGYYPDGWFLDLCDELGICLFYDLMFACTEVPVEPDFVENIKVEIKENIARVREHACIAIISGNNEIEQTFGGENSVGTKQRKDYLYLFEDVIPKIMRENFPELPFITSSPTSHGGFVDIHNENIGDSHYWNVWHGGLPFTEYRNHHFRYLSEFGFQSFPCEKTVEAFTEPEDRNIFSRIMEQHQRNGTANGKILGYMADTFRYPAEFGTLLYASQLLQAEAIRYGAEHLRRERGRCMGTLYWQFNDIWPVASWASVDYYGRWKALQYYAKRFYAPVLLSCEEVGEKAARPFLTMEDTVGYNCSVAFGVTNDTAQAFSGEIRWYLRNASGEIVRSETESVTVPAWSVIRTEKTDFGELDAEHIYCSYELWQGDILIGESTTLFTAPKHFAFEDPHLCAAITDDTITVYASAYAKSVEVDSPDSDFVLDDNYFDMNAGTKTLKVLSGEVKTLRLRSVYDIR